MRATRKWKKAVIHLECAGDSIGRDEQLRRARELPERFRRGKISRDQLAMGLLAGIRDVGIPGTAVFVAHKRHHYLVTARHVVEDRKGASSPLQKKKGTQHGLPEDITDENLRITEHEATGQISNVLFRVPGPEEMASGPSGGPREILMNVGAGGRYAQFAFSSPELDIAVISLGRDHSRFARELLAKGYSPISLDDIADSPSDFGAEVFSIGYPNAISIIDTRELAPAELLWTSGLVSLPAITFGRVSILDDSLHFFWCDMSVYPGNSGGPVVEAGRMVGLVSQQATMPVEVEENHDGAMQPPNARTRIPFAMAIKGKFVKDLLAAQFAEDASFLGAKRVP